MPYLTDLAEWCREAVAPYGTPVEEHPGWQTRGRSGGKPYESGRPWWVMYHHTASRDQDLADYHATGSDNAPVCNLDIAADGRVVVIAAGPTNTNGKGYALRTSKGTIEDDTMNSFALGIEFYNDGCGEPWPRIQVDVGFAVITTIQRKLGLLPTDCGTHEQWAPDRKVDPATADAVEGTWRPRAKNSSGTWMDDDLRDECVARSSGPPPDDEEEPVYMLARGSDGSMWAIGSDLTRFPMWPEDWSAMKDAKVAVEVDLRPDTVDRFPSTGTTDVIGDHAGGV